LVCPPACVLGAAPFRKSHPPPPFSSFSRFWQDLRALSFWGFVRPVLFTPLQTPSFSCFFSPFPFFCPFFSIQLDVWFARSPKARCGQDTHFLVFSVHFPSIAPPLPVWAQRCFSADFCRQLDSPSQFSSFFLFSSPLRSGRSCCIYFSRIQNFFSLLSFCTEFTLPVFLLPPPELSPPP